MVLTRVVRSALETMMLGLLVLCATAGTSRAVEEAPDIAARRAAAARLADEGFDLLEQQRCDEALESFRKADETLHSPMFVVFMARAERCLGRLVEAERHLRGVVREKLADYAPDSFWQAKQTAQQELAKLEPHIPKWTLRLEGARLSEASILLDGEPVEATKLGTAQSIDPGHHVVQAETLDGRTGKASFDAVEGKTVEVEIDVGEPLTDDHGLPPDESADEPSWDGGYLPAGIAYGFGGAGLVVGAITGGIFVGRANDLKDKCPNDQCPPEEEEEGDAVRTLGTISTVGFVVAGVGAVAGTILLFTVGGAEESAGELAKVRAGPGGLLLQGRF